MAQEIIINRSHREVRAALLENREIIDFLIDRFDHQDHGQVLFGNIYKGRVKRVLPGMQSAFVDIGYEKAAFLYVDDAYLPTLQEQREIINKTKKNLEEKTKEKRGELIPDEMSTLSEEVDMKFRPQVKIEEFLKEGDEIIVQIAKEPISTKGPRVTRQITLAGRYLVFMPLLEHAGVSRRIEEEGERERLKETLEAVKPEGMGLIARTVAESQSISTIKNDYNLLFKMWKDIDQKIKKAKCPSIIHSDLNFIQRTIRDIADEDINKIVVDNKNDKKQADKFIQKFLPKLKGKVEVFNQDTPIFEHYGIEVEIQRALSNVVFLKSGGSINVDQTEALVSIDVNTGKFVGKKSLEETILEANLQAVKEIAYQLRLRNCGGIIIIDFIDMERGEHREMVYRSLLEELKKDRAKTNVLPISELGLVEMTRKRTRDTLARSLMDPCPYCEGEGRVKSVVTMSYEILRELVKVMGQWKGKKVSLFAHPSVVSKITHEDIEIIESLEEGFQKTLIVRAENNYHIEQYDIITS